MDIQTLKSLVVVSGNTLSLSLDALESPALTQLFEPYLAGKTLVVNGVTERTETDDSVTVVGAGGNTVFAGMSVTAVFGVGADAAATVLVTARGAAGWTFVRSFPLLRRSLFDGLEFEPSPTLYLSSHQLSEQRLAGMSFEGTLKQDSPLSALAFLLGQGEQRLAGHIEVAEGAPAMMLLGPVNASADLGIFKITNIAYELYSEPKFNTAQYVWEATGFVGLSLDIKFSAQGQEHTIPLLTKIYDPRDSILLVTNLTEGLDAAMDELSALLGGVGLDVPYEGLEVTKLVKLSDMRLMVNPSSPSLLQYVTLGVQTQEELVLVEDLLTLEAIDLSFRVDLSPGSTQVSGVLSGLVGIGESGTLELGLAFGDVAFGGGLRAGDPPLSIKEVFEHFMKHPDSGLPDIRVAHFDFDVHPSLKTYSAAVELQAGGWPIHVGATELSIQDLKFSLRREAADGPTLFSSLGAFGIGDFSLVVSADYGGPAAGWTFKGGTPAGQPVPIGKFVQSLAETFNVNDEVPAPIADLMLTSLGVSFNTLTKNFSFTCGASLPVDGKSLAIGVLIELKNQNGVYTKTFGGSLAVGSLNFGLYFSQNNAETSFVAAYVHTGAGGGLNVRELVGYASESVAEYIPASLEIDLKDVLFAFDKGTAGTKFLFGMDVGARVSLSDLPLVGQKFPAEASVGVEDLRILVASAALSQAEATTVNNLIGLMPAPLARLPVQAGAATQTGGAAQPAVPDGLTVSALMSFGGSAQPLSLPVASSSPTTGQTTGTATTTTTAPGMAPVTSSDKAKWFTLQKAFGPVYFEKVGVRYQDEAVWFLLNAALSVAGLTLSLDGLAVGSSLKSFSPRFDLRGLGIDYKAGTVEVGGAFLRIPKGQSGKSYDEYAGAAVVRAEPLGLSALGSYAELDGHPSLFVYAVLDYPLGGPSFFFVTGLAAGFGYNRSLIVPTLDRLAQFPLVADATSGAGMPKDLGAKLASLQQSVPPAAGEYFLAFGIKFTSFKLVDSFALLTVSFGTQFEVNLLGLSTLVVPPPVPGETVTPLAEVQMALRATYNPSQGFLGVGAQLTSASFILSRDCHLTGGFAFYTWFGGEHEGDFVLTLGGYHPDYVVPAHYPQVPRVGFNWRVDSKLSLKGGAYYALTAAALMAGGSLQATWDDGDLKAHFNASADFIIYWQPYHYDAKISVDIGVSYTYNLFGTHHLNVDVGADLHIWGPEFAGKAHVKLSIISFDITFGSGSGRQLKPVSWDAFKESFLPKDKDGRLAVCGVSISGGMLSAPDAAGVDWVVNPKTLALVTDSVIPSKVARARGGAVPGLGAVESGFGVGPLDVPAADFSSALNVTLGKHNELTGEYEAAEPDFAFKPVLKNVPIALWGTTLTPPVNGPAFVRDTLAGFVVTPAAGPAPGATADIERAALLYDADDVPGAFAWGEFPHFVPQDFGADEEDADRQRRAAVGGSINTQATAANRARLLGALGVTAEVRLDGFDVAGEAFLVAPQVAAQTA